MSKKIICTHTISLFMCVAIPLAFAADLNPNGFPSGQHYNLNIHGKQSGFVCPAPQYYQQIMGCIEFACSGGYQTGQLVESCPTGYSCAPTDTQFYGNSIFVPLNTGGKIYMQSGKVGGKGSKASSLPQAELWAVDPCGFDESGAVIQLPPGEYDVYARALATPTDNPTMVVTPSLNAVEDENGIELYHLGLVTDNGFYTDSQSFTRSKGKSTAVPIRGLFEWSGDICYLVDPLDGTPSTIKCGIDEDSDGIYDSYVDPVNGICVEGTPVNTYCKNYQQEWVFNIGDFVDYLWSTNNSGLKLLQVRFYPR